MHPYHIQRVQLLNEDDFAPRFTFAHWYLEMCARDPHFPDTLLFTDVVTFTREGIFNSHNSHVWSTDNPHATSTHASQVRFSVNVSASIVGDNLFGPYLLPKRLTGRNYLISAASGEVRDTPWVLTIVRSSMGRRCQPCIMSRGRNFEHLL